MKFVNIIWILSSWSIVNCMCPTQCTCDDTTFVTSCADSKLDIVPITLNPSVQHLNLRSNKIKSVDSNVFFYQELRYVDFSYNHIVTFTDGSFSRQNNLIELHVAKNKISSLTNKTFTGLVKLKILNLRGNYLQELSAKLFKLLPNLEELDLGENRLSLIHLEAFVGLNNLKVLYLDDNQLSVIPTPSLTPLASLAELKVGLNSFSTLTDDIFKGLARLVSLDVSNSNLANISDFSFRGLDTLKSLNLVDNRFRVIPNNAIQILTRLEDLKIGQNLFETLQPGDFSGLSNLKSLEIKGAPNLEIILSNTFTENRNLESISLISNKKLREIEDGALSGLPKLRNVIFRDNALTTVSESLLNWSEMKKIDLSSNPIECSCKLLWLHELLLGSKSAELENGKSHHAAVQCVSPASLKDKYLRDISAEELGCASGDPRTRVAIAICLSVLVIILLIVFALTMRFKRRVRDALKDPPRWFPSRSASGVAKEHEYQKAQLGYADDDYMIRVAAMSAANSVHGYAHGLKPIPVTEL